MRHPTDGRVHFSELKEMRKSPKHFANACRKARDMSRPMMIGALADCLVFGQRGYAIYPGPTRRGKEWDAFKEVNAGKFLPIQSEIDDAKGAADAVLADPFALSLINSPGAEMQLCAQWEAYGLQMAAGIPGERGGFDLVGTLTEEACSFLEPIVLSDGSCFTPRPGMTFLDDLKCT